jgi:hypothetical protein
MPKHFTTKEARAVLEQSRRLLEDEPCEPKPPPFEVKFEDPMDRWRREADEAAAARVAADAERRAAEQAAADQRNAAAKRASDLALAERMALEKRVADLENQVTELARGTMGFSDAATTGLRRLENFATKLDHILEKLKATHTRELDHLRTRLAANEALHGREVALLGRQLDDARKEVQAITAQHERKQYHADLVMTGNNVVELLQGVRKDLASRN